MLGCRPLYQVPGPVQTTDVTCCNERPSPFGCLGVERRRRGADGLHPRTRRSSSTRWRHPLPQRLGRAAQALPLHRPVGAGAALRCPARGTGHRTDDPPDPSIARRCYRGHLARLVSVNASLIDPRLTENRTSATRNAPPWGRNPDLHAAE